MSSNRRHLPPPTKFGSPTVQSKPSVSLPSPTPHHGPVRTAAVQAKAGRFLPPPTPYSGPVEAGAVQTKARGFLPPPTPYRGPVGATAVQAKTANFTTGLMKLADSRVRCGVMGRGAIQRMEDKPKYVVKGENPVIWVDTDLLYDKWQRSQKEDNIRSNSVDFHVDVYNKGTETDPITIQSIQFDDDNVVVRTLDGRHHLLAAKKIGLQRVAILDTPTAREVLEAVGIPFYLTA